MTQKGTFYKDAGRNHAKILPQEVVASGVGVRSLGLAGDKIYLLQSRPIRIGYYTFNTKSNRIK